MENEGYLVDTNVLIDFLANKLPASGMKFVGTLYEAGLRISVISKIELLGFHKLGSQEKLISDFLAGIEIVYLTDAIVDRTIQVRRVCRVALPDAIIAATALVYNQVLLTRNTADFLRVDGLSLSNPHQL